MPESLLPPNASPLEKALDRAAGKHLEEIPVPVGDLWSAENCPVQALPWLAWALAVDNWGHSWPEEIKRRVISQAFQIHAQRGTVAALKRLLESIEAEYEYSEPETLRFTVVIHNSNTIPLSDLAGLGAAIDQIKRAAAHYTLELHAGLTGEVPIAGGLSMGLGVTPVEIDLDTTRTVETSGELPLAAGLGGFSLHEVRLWV